ncbi:MAG: hypothetical protein KDK70_16210, partial [Myxococcales bacterium]|nr:hypothetical protein [Myxococcales bacterium]
MPGDRRGDLPSPEVCAGLRQAGYELVHRLGEGGMGELWAAARLGAHGAVKPCVLKTIRPALAGDARCRRLLIDEGRVGMLLGHANLVSAFDLCLADERPFLAMDWVDGVDLATLGPRACRRVTGPLDVADAVHVAGALLDALSYLHG